MLACALAGFVRMRGCLYEACSLFFRGLAPLGAPFSPCNRYLTAPDGNQPLFLEPTGTSRGIRPPAPDVDSSGQPDANCGEPVGRDRRPEIEHPPRPQTESHRFLARRRAMRALHSSNDARSIVHTQHGSTFPPDPDADPPSADGLTEGPSSSLGLLHSAAVRSSPVPPLFFRPSRAPPYCAVSWSGGTVTSSSAPKAGGGVRTRCRSGCLWWRCRRTRSHSPRTAPRPPRRQRRRTWRRPSSVPPSRSRSRASRPRFRRWLRSRTSGGTPGRPR